MDIRKIREELDSLVAPQYREFHASLIPGTTRISGVRCPHLREMAKRLSKEEWCLGVYSILSEFYE